MRLYSMSIHTRTYSFWFGCVGVTIHPFVSIKLMSKILPSCSQGLYNAVRMVREDLSKQFVRDVVVVVVDDDDTGGTALCHSECSCLLYWILWLQSIPLQSAGIGVRQKVVSEKWWCSFLFLRRVVLRIVLLRRSSIDERLTQFLRSIRVGHRDTYQHCSPIHHYDTAATRPETRVAGTRVVVQLE